MYKTLKAMLMLLCACGNICSSVYKTGGEYSVNSQTLIIDLVSGSCYQCHGANFYYEKARLQGH